MFEPTCARLDAATTIFNLSDDGVISAETLAFGQRRIRVESTFPPGCPACGVISTRRHSRRWQRIRDIPIAGAAEVLWSKRRWFCDEWRRERKSFTETTPQVPARARSTRRLREALVAAVIGSGRAAWRDSSCVRSVVVAGPACARCGGADAAGCGQSFAADAGH